MPVELKQLKYFHIFHRIWQKKKDSNKADAILIATYYHETFGQEE
jgi:hypothetical protein